MFLGLLFAISACFLWGLIFVVPYYLADYSLVEVVLGRYFTYGVLSALLFFSSGFSRIKRYNGRAWAAAFAFGLVSNLFYYLGLVAGLRFLSPTLTVLLVGLAPLGIAFYGNWHSKDLAFRSLVIPALSISLGLILVHATEVDWSFQGRSSGQIVLGFFGVMTALMAWVWYAVQNARFLKKNQNILPSEWATVMGVATLFWTLLIGGILAVGLKEEVNLSKFFVLSSATLRYFVGASILGVLCSWVGCYLWSRASVYLPLFLMGPLLVFEVLFGLLFVYLYKGVLPSGIETLGVATMIGGILMSLNAFRKRQVAEK